MIAGVWQPCVRSGGRDLHEVSNALTLATPLLRDRLVRRARRWGATRESAEDLAQETLGEAWRLRSRVYDANGLQRWVDVIFEHVYRRWRHSSDVASRPAGPDVEAERPRGPEDNLELGEAVGLARRVLGSVPSAARQVLVERLMEERPVKEVAARLGVSEAAVKMRTKRGLDALRRALPAPIDDDEASVMAGIIIGDWRTSPIWCDRCGTRRLLARFQGPGRRMLLRCPGCAAPGALHVDVETGWYPTVGFGAMYCHLQMITERFWCEGMPGIRRHPHLVQITRHVQAGDGHGISARCEGCRFGGVFSLGHIALSTGEGQRFQQAHARIRQVSQFEAEVGGVRAVVTSFKAVAASSRLDVVLGYDTLAVLAVRQT